MLIEMIRFLEIIVFLFPAKRFQGQHNMPSIHLYQSFQCETEPFSIHILLHTIYPSRKNKNHLIRIDIYNAISCLVLVEGIILSYWYLFTYPLFTFIYV